MWHTILAINSILWMISGVFFIYAFGTAVITWSWKQFLVAFVIFLFFSIAELVINGIMDP